MKQLQNWMTSVLWMSVLQEDQKMGKHLKTKLLFPYIYVFKAYLKLDVEESALGWEFSHSQE